MWPARVSNYIKLQLQAQAGWSPAYCLYLNPTCRPGSTNPLLADHGQTEVALAASGIPWTALRNDFYAEALRNFLDLLLVKGQLLIPEGSAKHSWISREDCARAAAGALLGKLTSTGPIDVTGSEALSFADLASRLSSLSDHQIHTHGITQIKKSLPRSPQKVFQQKPLVPR